MADCAGDPLPCAEDQHNPFTACRRATVWYKHWRRGACLTQEELEDTLRGPAFELDHRYGEGGQASWSWSWPDQSLADS